MGFSVKNPKTGRILFLHTKVGRSKKDLYFFGYKIIDSIDLPPDLEVKFCNCNGHPYVKRRIHGTTQNLNSR